jgi:mRNA interferase HigB
MVIINLRMLDIFAKKHSDARKSLAVWKKRQDVLNSFPNAKILANNRARFEIKHNKYRLIAEVFYDDKYVEIRFIGTHSDYDKIDPTTI